MSSSDILERPDVRDADTGNANEVFHYVRKNKIAESAVMGTMVEALCGEVFPVTKSPKPGSPVCPACKEIYEQLKKAEATSLAPPRGAQATARPDAARAGRASCHIRASAARPLAARRRSWRRSGAGQRAWIVALSSAPSSTAMPKKKQNSSAPMGAASAP